MNDYNARAVPWFRENQHCTFPKQDGEDDYSFSHTAQYCGREQPRLCGCAFCYGDDRVSDFEQELGRYACKETP